MLFAEIAHINVNVCFRLLEQHAPKDTQLISTQPDATRRDLQIGAIPRYFVVNEHGHYKTFTTLQQAELALANTIGSQ